MNPADYEEEDDFDEEAAAALDEVLEERPVKKCVPPPFAHMCARGLLPCSQLDISILMCKG